MKHKHLILILIAIVGYSSAAYPIAQEKDNAKKKQWLSIENGPWDFEPGLYYYLSHQLLEKYSGAHWSWQWAGFKSGWKIKFDERKSKVKRVMPVRTSAGASELLRKDKANKELKLFKDPYDEEVEKAADRNADLVYSMYKEDFNKMQDIIAVRLEYCMNKSKGKMYPEVSQVLKQNKICCENVKYIHKTGKGYELENAKRREAYEKAKSDMRDLVSVVNYMCEMATICF